MRYETPNLVNLGRAKALVLGGQALFPEDSDKSVITTAGDLVLGLDD